MTSLDRHELLKIVREVVSQLQDSEIEDTVSTLMRATTERLVLVSTPEAGTHVRFDIRPLQEFFAAEHIYQSGEPDVFVERIRVVVGDSHWREVLHFIVSALIENNRKAELAAAITVLRQIDDGGDEHTRVLMPAVALLLGPDVVAGKSYACELVGTLLDYANVDFVGRSSIDFAIKEWREIASAPVRRLAQPELWK